MQNIKQTIDDPDATDALKTEDAEPLEITDSLEIESESDANQSQTTNTDDKNVMCTSLTEILPGTPIVINNSGVSNVPTSENFSVGICEHKPYEMYTNTTGHYQKIVKVTRKLKFKNYVDGEN